MKGSDMKRLIMTTAALLLLTPGWAAQQSVTLSVPGMSCDTKVKVDVLTKATTEAGFPSSVAPAKP